MESTRVRRLKARDIDAAIRLTDLEDWGYSPSDFRRLLELSPGGCFAAELAGEVVGVLTTTTYDGLAFLGAVIVRPELRGRGVGKQMMEAALDHLRALGVVTVRLNAYLNAIPFYERLGFRREYEVIRWHGPATSGRATGVRPARRSDIARIGHLDKAYFGADRTPLLERLAEEFPDSFLVYERSGEIRGYIVGNVSGDACEIGPWTVPREGDPAAPNLFHGLVAASGAREIAFSGPSRNEPLLAFVKQLGYAEVFRALRMVWGEDRFAGDPSGVWALGGLEKG